MTDYWCAPTVTDLRLGSATFVTASLLERDVSSSEVAVSLEKIKREETCVLTVLLLVAVAAFIVTIVAAMNKCPLWPAVLLLAVAEMLRALPLGR
jgi:hypothetical protein